MSVLTVYVRAPSGCLLDDGGGVWKFLDVPGRSWCRGEWGVRWNEPEVGRAALAVLGVGVTAGDEPGVEGGPH